MDFIQIGLNCVSSKQVVVGSNPTRETILEANPRLKKAAPKPPQQTKRCKIDHLTICAVTLLPLISSLTTLAMYSGSNKYSAIRRWKWCADTSTWRRLKPWSVAGHRLHLTA
jgi:hypothetical protein